MKRSLTAHGFAFGGAMESAAAQNAPTFHSAKSKARDTARQEKVHAERRRSPGCIGGQFPASAMTLRTSPIHAVDYVAGDQP